MASDSLKGDNQLKFVIDMVKQPWSTPVYHARLKTSVTGDQEFCADTHCRGDCGYPGLFLRRYLNMNNGLEREYAEAARLPTDQQGRTYDEYKAHGSSVASGPVWQRATRWLGEKVYLPDEYERVHDMWWW